MTLLQDQKTLVSDVGFKSIQLLKDQTLGIGSYGSVCKALCDDLLCAAKVIHPTLFNPKVHKQAELHKEHRLPIHRFLQECEFMSAIRHPNIVQFLGTHQDPQTGLPVLLMELMDDSLTHFLESSQDAVPYHIQVNFCHDITLAISYLHSNGITHRDLSSNNVLLRGNVQAKVSDFGMAKLGDLNPEATRASFTLCPGTLVYMPPEAVKDIPEYTVKIDCFAIGALIIQILTKHFPDPGRRLKQVHTTDPQFPGGIVEVRAPEIERRQNHISLVDPNHPLLPIALDCLKDSDVERPSAQELCHRVAALKEMAKFKESMHKVRYNKKQGSLVEENVDSDDLQQLSVYNDIIKEKDDIITEKEQAIEDVKRECEELKKTIIHKDELFEKKSKELKQTITDKDEAIERQCEEHRQIIHDKDELIEEKEKIYQDVCQQLESSQQVIAERETKIQELEEQLQSAINESNKTNSSDRSAKAMASWIDDGFPLTWKMTLYKDFRTPSAVLDGEMLYLRPGETRVIYAYNTSNCKWERLPDCETEYCTLAMVNNLLTTIGGRDSDGNVTNNLYILTDSNEEESSIKWRVIFQSMPTKRSSSVAVCTGPALIVAGGLDQWGVALKKVEIMDTATQQWSSAAELPEPLYAASFAICHERLYFLGGWGDCREGATRSVYTCLLFDLYQSCQSKVLGQRLAQYLSLTSPPRSDVWDKVASLPITRSACVAFYDRLVVIGGVAGKLSADVRIYHPVSNTWEVIGSMETKRYGCFAAVLPTNEILVVGGFTNEYLSYSACESYNKPFTRSTRNITF